MITSEFCKPYGFVELLEIFNFILNVGQIIRVRMKGDAVDLTPRAKRHDTYGFQLVLPALNIHLIVTLYI